MSEMVDGITFYGRNRHDQECEVGIYPSPVEAWRGYFSVMFDGLEKRVYVPFVEADMAKTRNYLRAVVGGRMDANQLVYRWTPPEDGIGYPFTIELAFSPVMGVEDWEYFRCDFRFADFIIAAPDFFADPHWEDVRVVQLHSFNKEMFTKLLVAVLNVGL